MALEQQIIVQTILRERIEILAYINSFLNDAHLAEDCFQEVCSAAVTKVDAFDDETHVIRWTLAAARNKAIDHARKRTHQPVTLDDDVLDLLEGRWVERVAEHPSDANVQSRALTHCLEQLNANNRRIVELRYFDGLKTARVAELLDRNVEAVYRALTRIHTTLKECVDRRLAQ